MITFLASLNGEFVFATANTNVAVIALRAVTVTCRSNWLKSKQEKQKTRAPRV
jgi:hypothetical protein